LGSQHALSLVAQAIAIIVAAGLTAVWLYALRSTYRSIEAAKKARRALGPRPCNSRVSVIIAARNEAHNLERLLPRLLSTGFHEIIVVDDGSTDHTWGVLTRLSEKDKRVVAIRVEQTPRGWAPKPYALQLGAGRASGDILLFLDADVEPFDAERLRCTAAKTQANEIIGLVPLFLCPTRRCAAIEAVVTATAYGFYGLHRVMNPGDKLGWMYGCCWAIRRETYWELGGHRLVAPSYVEDRDFATEAKKRGIQVLLPDARDTIGVWTYPGLNEFAWLIARLFLDPLRRRDALGKTVAITATLLVTYGPLVLAAAAPAASPPLTAILAAPLAVQAIAYAAGAMIEGYNPLYALPGLVYGQLVYPLGLLRALLGKIYWKQRIIT